MFACATAAWMRWAPQRIRTGLRPRPGPVTETVEVPAGGVQPPVRLTATPNVDRVLTRARLRASAAPGTEDCRPVLILTGGGQQGVIGASVFRALGPLIRGFSACVGISTGSAPILYHDEVDERGISIYWTENVRRKLFSMRRPWRPLDLAGLEKVFRSEKPPVNLAGLRDHPTRFLIGVYDRRLRREVFVDAGKCRDVVGWAIHSMRMPAFFPRSRYVDGALGEPLPITFVSSALGATDILVIMSTPPSFSSGLARSLGRIGEAVAGAMPGMSYLATFASYPRRFDTELALLFQGGATSNVAAIYPEASRLSSRCQDPALLEAAARDAFTFARGVVAPHLEEGPTYGEVGSSRRVSPSAPAAGVHNWAASSGPRPARPLREA